MVLLGGGMELFVVKIVKGVELISYWLEGSGGRKRGGFG